MAAHRALSLGHRRLLLLALLGFLLGLVCLGVGGCRARRGSSAAQGEGPTSATVLLRINVDPVARGFELNSQMAREYEKIAGVRIELIGGPLSSTDRLSQYLQYLGACSADIDIFQIDVIWTGALAEHLIDLKEAFAPELPQYFPRIVENNTVQGRLVAAPWFADAGVLYYRTDLLKKYGYASPPERWEDLQAMATRIQVGERAAGHPDFWGYVWQGKAYEGLTCNALEWLASSGGGSIFDSKGRVTVDNPQARNALQRAVGWVGAISPPGVTMYQEEEARQVFQQGNAAFMRNWPYAYALGMASTSPIRDKFALTLLPGGAGGRAATLGGWQLAVSRYSKHPKEAIGFVKYLTTREAQKRRALYVSLLPTTIELYSDPELTGAIPFLPVMKEVLLHAVARPSTQAKEAYNEVSTRFFQGIHRALTGQLPPQQALERIDRQLRLVLE